MFPRWRGRIILSRDPDGEEGVLRAIFALWLVQSTVSLQKGEMEDGRWYPEFSHQFFTLHNVWFVKKLAPRTRFS